MRRLIAAALAIGLLTAAAVGVAVADHGSDSHSENMTLIANFSDDGTYRVGTDMAFWGDLALLGTLDQGTGPNASPPGGFRMMDVSDPRRPRFLQRFLPRPQEDPERLLCPGGRCTAVWGVDVEGDVVVASDMIGGLWVLRLRR